MILKELTMKDLEKLQKENEEILKKLKKIESQKFNFGKFLENNRGPVRFFTIGFLMVGLVAYGTLSLPHTFTAGETISASKVNQNFQALAESGGGGPQTVADMSISASVDYDTTDMSLGGSNGYEIENFMVFDDITTGSTGSLFNSTGTNIATVYKVPSSGWYQVYARFNPTLTKAPGATDWSLAANFYLCLAELNGTELINMPDYVYNCSDSSYNSYSNYSENVTNEIQNTFYLTQGQVLYFKSVFAIGNWGSDYLDDEVGLNSSDTLVKIIKI